MNVTVAVSSPAPGKAPVAPGFGSAMAGETAQAGEGETGDFAAMMRNIAGAPAHDPEGLKSDKSASPPEGRKAKKDKAKGEEALLVQAQPPETTKAASVPAAASLIPPANADTSPSSVEGGTTETAEGVSAIRTGAASAPRAGVQGEAPASRATEADEVGAEKAAPAEFSAPAETATGKRRRNASPEATSEPKARVANAEVDDALPTKKTPVAAQASDESDRAAPKAAPGEVMPSRRPAASPPGEPTRTRTGSQRGEDGAIESPGPGNGEVASQPVRAGEAIALLAAARKADRRAPLVAEDGAPLPPVSEKSAFPAKGAGAAQASPVALAAVQSAVATRAARPEREAAGKQPDRTSEMRETPLASRPDAPGASASPAAASPLPTTVATAGAASTGGVALSGALGQQVVDMGVSGQWIDDIARQIATVAANPGHGSFRIASEALGAVRVDLTPGKNGSDVLMTVDSDAARAALTDQTDRLMQDARLASVRLGEVRVERAVTSADAPRSDTSQQQNGGGQGTPAHAQASMGQGGGQPDQHSARHDAAMMNQQGGNSPKTPFIKSVLQDSGTSEQSAPDRGRSPDRARYA